MKPRLDRKTAPRLGNMADAARFFGCGMAGVRSERLCVAHLDAEGSLLGVSLGYSRARDEVAVPLRRIAADALRLGTRAMVIAHNHPDRPRMITFSHAQAH